MPSRGYDGKVANRSGSGGNPTVTVMVGVIPLVEMIFIPGLWWTWADSPFPFDPPLFWAMTAAVAVVTILLVAVITYVSHRGIAWSLGMATVVGFGATRSSTWKTPGAVPNAVRWSIDVFATVSSTGVSGM